MTILSGCASNDKTPSQNINNEGASTDIDETPEVAEVSEEDKLKSLQLERKNLKRPEKKKWLNSMFHYRH